MDTVFTRSDLGMSVPRLSNSTLEEYYMTIIQFAKAYGWEDDPEHYGNDDESNYWRVYDIYHWLSDLSEYPLFWDFDNNDILTLQVD